MYVARLRSAGRSGQSRLPGDAPYPRCAPDGNAGGARNWDYQVFRDPREPSLFVLFERYADERAFDPHRASPHFVRWLAQVVLPALDHRVRLDLVPLDA
jgi:hypothetical protein